MNVEHVASFISFFLVLCFIFSEVFLRASLLAFPPTVTDALTLPAGGPFCPAALGLQLRWPPGCSNPIHLGCYIPLPPVVSLFWLPFTFRVSASQHASCL